ncbi:MAG: LamG-like jellyroll fold domain-containing protein, partial [Acidimicrobiales bacterium]
MLALVAVAGLPISPLSFGGSAVALDYKSTVLADGPRSYWRLGTGAIGTDEKNFLPLDYSGVQSGQAGAINGDANTAVYLDGLGPRIYETSPGNPNPLGFGQFSLETWFKTAPGWLADGYLMHVGDGFYRLAVKEGKLRAEVTVQSGATKSAVTVASNTWVGDSQWHHVVLTGDALRLRLYVDGVEVAGRAIPGPAVKNGSATDVALGWKAIGTAYFKGYLDEAAVYDKALTAAQVGSHYTTSGRALRLIGGPLQDDERRGGCAPCSPNIASTQGQATDYPVNTATGNFWHTFNDLAVPGRGIPLNLQRTYNSNLAGVDSPFGWGWASTYTMKLAVAVPSGNVTITQENGSEVDFTASATTYAAAPRVNATLTKNTDGTFTFVRNASETFTFDASGRLTSQKDLHNYLTTITRPNATTMVVTERGGRTLTFAFTGTRITSVTDTAVPPRTVTFTYNAAGELEDVTDVGNGVTHFTYDANHRMLTMLDPGQHGSPTATPVTNHYDAGGRVDWQKDALNRQTTFAYTATQTTITDPKGNVTVETYDDDRLRRSLTRASGTAVAATWQFEYDLSNVGLTKVTDPNGHQTVMTYDQAGNVLTVKDALQKVTTYAYDAQNHRTSTKDAKGVVTDYTYVAGNLTEVKTTGLGTDG